MTHITATDIDPKAVLTHLTNTCDFFFSDIEKDSVNFGSALASVMGDRRLDAITRNDGDAIYDHLVTHHNWDDPMYGDVGTEIKDAVISVLTRSHSITVAEALTSGDDQYVRIDGTWYMVGAKVEDDFIATLTDN